MFKNLFKNNAVQIQLVKTDQPQIANNEDLAEETATTVKMVTDSVVKVAVTVGVIVGAGMILNAICTTASEVTINKLS